ncbi:MAG: single-stranded DNA-binding protein [Oscillospiraceae bacterium]|nr:single-stranded DNA-binding protein [Oscillospiraceae bacterium]
MLNCVTLMGRMTKDHELRYTQSQTPVATFTLAVDRDYKKGEEKQTDFIDCVAWKSTAEFVSRSFSKGMLCVVEGRLQIRAWEDAAGNKRRNAEVVVENIYYGASKPKEEMEKMSGEDPFKSISPEDDGDLPF